MTEVRETIAKSRKQDGMGPHVLSFIVSILLTMMAFAAVIFTALDRTFVLIFIVSLAIVQVLFQLIYWMHMKDKGHAMPIIFLSGGVIIILPIIITALFWMWGY